MQSPTRKATTTENYQLSQRGAPNYADRDIWGPRGKSMGDPWSPTNPDGSPPHNPLGRCYPPETLKEFAAFCGENDLHLISDEI
ncbi:uncharacterized protein N7469_009398 [Penicillium citrinum]|uniref:Aminotransferase class I/classII large domain-containing protein n=1 Tax=Penicillium citrinum TaxID=5077 RepID=A0A9W9THS0_PENCI|nr:uncharacterized protein N7469_009398 [Penicillium citrinum]KAJ5223158.1 hypothetical protein N7469_009398 [Penicillium citrinum]